MLQINLSKAEIEKLNYNRYSYPCPIVQKRIYAVYLKATQTMSNDRIGELVGLSRDSVDYWIKVYLNKGFDALCRYKYGTNKSELETYSDSILKSFRDHPPMNVNEALSIIIKMTGIKRSPTQVQTFMKSHGLRYLKTGHIPAKADTEKQKKWVLSTLEPAIEEAQNKECHLLFMDAAHFILQPFLCSLWCFTRIFIKASSGRNRINVLGTVNAITKEVLTLCNTTYISADVIVEFLKILKSHYNDLPIKIILDNARYQHCKLVEEAANRMGITLLFLPSYSPNLNIIERLWKFTKKSILYAKFYETPQIFHQAITGFFKDINDNYQNDLNKLMTLKFQFFQNENAEIYAA